MGNTLETILKQLTTDVGNQTTAPGSTWSELFTNKRYSEALAEVETELSNSPQSLLAKLWWVRCQLAIGKVPFMALTAPLEEAYDSLRSSADLHPLSVQTYVEVATSLAAKKQYRISIHLLERALNFLDANNAGSVPLRRSMHNTLAELINEEILRAEKSRESKQYLQTLNDKQKMFAQWVTKEDGNSTHIGAPLVEQQIEKSEAYNRHRLIGLGLLAICAIAALAYGLFTPHESGPPLEARAALRLDTQQPPDAVPPQIQPILAGTEKGTHEVVTQLRAVGDRLKNIGVGQSGAAESSSSSETAPEVDKQSMQENFKPETSATATSESYDPSSFGDVKPSLPPPAKDDKAPLLDPDKLANRSVEVIGDSGRKVSVEKLEHTPEGRVYGPPRDTPEEAEGKKDLRGNPVKSYPVDKFGSPRQYRTLTATDVLSQPSYVARPLARLDRGATVDVVSRMGEWLEIRSAAGRVGYILAQDASEVR